MTRKEAEDAREAKLVELRKKYLDSKGIISKAKPSAKVKLTGLDKVEAEREAKLVELREKYLAKKREVTKSIVPTVKKMDTATKKKSKSVTGRSKVLGTEKYIAKGKKTGTAKPSSGTGRSKVLGTEKYIAKGNRAGTAKPLTQTKAKKGDGKLASVVKRSSGVFKKKGKIPEGRGINKKVPKSVSRMTLAEKEFYFNINNKDNPSIKKGTKKSSAGTFVTYPQFTLAEYLKMSKRDRYLVGLPESDKRLSRNSRDILTFTPIKN